jgi:hypothetical protein
VTNYLKSNHAELITITKFQIPNYEVINFSAFLKKQYEYSKPFILEKQIAIIKDNIRAKYGNFDKCIKEHGVKESVHFGDLSYYQTDIGIKGPQFNNLEEPVYILRLNDQIILMNGYHRILIKIVRQESILGFVLEMPSY